MAAKDQLLYYNLRARAEAIRMLYALAGKEFEDKRFSPEEWPALKPSTPLGQAPTLTTSDGVLCQSNVIARHAARKFGMVGKTQWEETLHDLIIECSQEAINMVAVPNIYAWLVFKAAPEPANKEEVIEAAKQKWIKVLNFIQTHADKQGKKFIVGDGVGLADIWLWCGMDFCKLGCTDIFALTPWTKEWAAKFESDPAVKKYLESRPEAAL